MKIIIHSLDELLELTALIRGGTSTTKVGEVEHTIKVDASNFDPVKMALEINDHCSTLRGEYEFEQACNRGLPADIAAPATRQNELPHKSSIEESTGPSQTLHLDGSVTTDYEEGELDIDGLPWDARINSGAKTQTGKGVWKRLRGVTDEVYESVRAELIAARCEHETSDCELPPEPVATETHALPQDELTHVALVDNPPDPACTVQQSEAPTVDLAALVEASQEAALDASDSHMDLIKACQVFISEYGHPAYNALKAAVAPLEGAENGKAVPQFTPGERRLMRACIDKYPKGE